MPLQLRFYCAQLLLKRRSQLIHLHHRLPCSGYSIIWVGHSHDTTHERTHLRRRGNNKDSNSASGELLTLDRLPAPVLGAESDPPQAAQSSSCLLGICTARLHVRQHLSRIILCLCMHGSPVGKACVSLQCRLSLAIRTKPEDAQGVL